jgi:Tfp pilus assembly protein PilF
MYERLIKLAPRNARYLNNLGYHLAELGVRLDRALACTEQAIKLVPNSADFIDSYGWVLFKLGRLKEAEYQIRRAIIIDSTIAEIWEHLGDIYWASGKKREAKRVWKKALDMGGVEDEAELREKLNRSD